MGEAKRGVELSVVDGRMVEPGDVIAGKYTIKRVLGRGGMGDVYLASPGSGKPDVALKMLSQRWLGDRDAVARFERETSHLRGIEHPNIVQMYDSGIDRGRPYLTMEYIDGESLSDFLARKGPLSLAEFVPIAAQMLKAMGYAHLREMMIRDVKPSNIMLCTRKGRANFVKLLDFGLAKFTSGEPPLTEGCVLGTVGYLAPEAIRGEPLDLRVDVYAIGVAFYHMLGGVLPFAGYTGATVLYKTLDEPPKPLAELRDDDAEELPAGLLELVDDCLAKDRADRPDDANAVVERLIDVVPVAYFRLPDASRAQRPPGAGNTGLIELIGANPSIRTTPVAPPESVTIIRERRRVRDWAIIIAIACLASIATAFAVTSGSRESEGEVAAASPVGVPEPLAPKPEPPASKPEPLPLRAQADAVAAEVVPANGPAEAKPQDEATVGDTTPEALPESEEPPAEPVAPTPTPRAKRRRAASRTASKQPTAAAAPSTDVPAPAPSEPAPVAAPAELQPAVAPQPERRSVFMSAQPETATKESERGGLLHAD